MSLCVNGRVFGEAEGRGHLSCLSGAGLHLHRQDGQRKDGDCREERKRKRKCHVSCLNFLL